MNLYDRCETLFAVNRKIVKRDWRGCAHSVLGLTSPVSDTTYHLYRFCGKHPYYSLFPVNGVANDGSFIYPDGSFTQHGVITQEHAELVIGM
jgi:hypothetical protein